MSDVLEVDMTPDPPTLNALANQRFGWGPALAELLDNAFDQGATQVSIIVHGKSITVKDNGEGVSDLADLFKMGRHVSRRRDTIGRYGIGFKQATTFIGGTLRVASAAQNKIRDLSVKLSKIDTWKHNGRIHDATPEACRAFDVNYPSGLTIHCADIERKSPGDHHWKDLAYTFGPGLRQGLQILIGTNGKKAKPLTPWAFPELEDSLLQHDEINGRTFTITAGLVRVGTPNPKPGFTLAYRHRVITTTSDPCKEFDSGHFFAFVELGPTWRLSTYKDALHEAEYDELVDRLAAICRPILLKAQERSEALQLKDLSNALTELAGQAIGVATDRVKEKRGPSTKPGEGAHSAPGNGRARRRFTRTQPGTQASDGTRGTNGIKISFAELGEDGGLSSVELKRFKSSTQGQADRIILNASHPAIARCRAEKNKLALIITALSEYAMTLASASEDEQQRRLPFSEPGASTRTVYSATLQRWMAQLGRDGLERLLVAV